MRLVALLSLALLGIATSQAMGQKALRLSATLTDPAKCGSQSDGDPTLAYAYVVMARDVNYHVAAGDKLAYEILIPAESTLSAGGVDFEGIVNATVGDRLRDSGAKDQYGLYAHPATDLAKLPKKADGSPAFARGKWITREVALTEQEGATMNTFLLATDEHDTFHQADTCPTDKQNPKVVVYFRNIRFVDKEGKVRKPLYNGEETLSDGKKQHTETLWLTDTMTNPVVEIASDPNPENK
jgi:hypothetical protein